MYAPIKFPKKDPANFFRTLNTRVNQYFKDNNLKKTGGIRMYIKSICVISMYLIPFILILSGVFSGWGVILGYLLMGFGMVGIGFSVMHDANHGSYSRKKWVNNFFSYSMNFMGASSFTWKIQHNVLHHSYTNVYELDEDIDDKPFLRLSPHGKFKKYHRFQHYYALFLYSLSNISWVIQKDIRQLIAYNKQGITRKSGFNPTREAIIMVISKVIYFFYTIGLPIIMGASWPIVLLGFLLMHMIAGLVITVVFQLAHVVEGPEHSTVPQSGSLHNTWAIHQLHTTANFAHKNPIVTWLTGGLNHQIEHHLFPSICHIHYPEVAKIVRSTVKEFDLPYHEHPRLYKAISSHFRVLRSLGREQVPSMA